MAQVENTQKINGINGCHVIDIDFVQKDQIYWNGFKFLEYNSRANIGRFPIVEANEGYEFIVDDKEYVTLHKKEEAEEYLVIKITPAVRQFLDTGIVWLDADICEKVLYLSGYAGKHEERLSIDYNIIPTTIEKRPPSGE
ncbi:MAG: hypothetical protein ACRDFB_01455 [Rhabdochlamydiaceae bacterium]